MWPTFFQQIIIRKEKYGGESYNAKILKAPINQITTGPYLLAYMVPLKEMEI